MAMKSARALAAVLFVGTAAMLVVAEPAGENVLTLTADNFDQAIAVCM